MGRLKFADNWVFVCSCIGYSVGLGNLWRFPYVCYKNGGAAFLVPYVLTLILIGRPLYYLELLLGQFSGHGPLGAFRLSPMLQGNALAMAWGAFGTSVYYQMVVAYAAVYFFMSFKRPLPWNECFEWWGVPLDGCFARRTTNRLCDSVRKSIVAAGVNDSGAGSLAEVTYRNKTVFISQQDYSSSFAGCVSANASSAEVFFNRYVLNVSSGIEHVGDVQTNLVLAYALCWVTVFLFIFSGIKVLEKVVVVTATAPYILLIVLLVRGVTLPGSGIGIAYLLVPTWSKVLDLTVWTAAVEQVLYSLGIGAGGLLVYGAYQDFRADIRSSVRFICFVDLLTSALAALVVFSVLGNAAFKLNMPIEDVANNGPGLAFVTYPEVLSLIPFSNGWSALFFATLFLLGIGTQIASCGFLTAAIQELLPGCLGQRSLSSLVYCFICFMVGLCLTTRAGFYLLTILDNYLGARILLFTCLLETITVGWVYGMSRFCFDVTFMTGICPSYYFMISVKYASPVVLSTLIVYTMVTFPRSSTGFYTVPVWADVLGWVLIGVGLMPVILIAEAKLAECNFNCRRAISPEQDWGPYEDNYRIHYRQRLRELGYRHLYHHVSPLGSPSLMPAESARGPQSQHVVHSAPSKDVPPFIIRSPC